MDDMPEANDPDVERIANGLVDYIVNGCMFRDTLKFTICEALYEMQAIARGDSFKPAVTVVVATPETH